MPLLKTIVRFLKKPLYEKYNSASCRYYKIKTALIYKLFFGSMGKNCSLRRPVFLANPQYIHLGSNVHIHDGARLEAIVHTVRRIPNLSIGDNVNIEQNVHIICQSHVRIGNNVSITGNCVIVDTTHPYHDVRDPAKIGDRILDEESFVEVGDSCFLGFGSMIMPNVRVGKYCIVGAHAVVTKDVPDYSVVAGSPARVIRRYDAASDKWVTVEPL